MNTKDTKTQFRWFTIFDYEKEQEYLRQMHASGWKFIGISLLGFYHFTACEPEDVIYQLDYNPDGLDNKSAYLQMFEDCGWEYLLDFGGYSYFRKPKAQMQGEEGIFCDESSRQEMMKRVFRGRLLPLIPLFFLCIIPNLFIQSSLHGFAGLLFQIYCGIFALYVVIFVSFAVQYWNYRQKKR